MPRQMFCLFKHPFTRHTLVNVYSLLQHDWSISYKFHNLLTQCFCVWTRRCFSTLSPQVKTLWHGQHSYRLFSNMNHLMLFQDTTLKLNTYHKSNKEISSWDCQKVLSLVTPPRPRAHVDQMSPNHNMLILEVLRRCAVPD